MEVVHTIIKEETKGMALEELKALAIQEKSNLFAAIDEGRIHTDLMEDLIIFEDQSWNQSLAVSKSESYKISKKYSASNRLTGRKEADIQRKILQSYKESYLSIHSPTIS